MQFLSRKKETEAAAAHYDWLIAKVPGFWLLDSQDT